MARRHPRRVRPLCRSAAVVGPRARCGRMAPRPAGDKGVPKPSPSGLVGASRPSAVVCTTPAPFSKAAARCAGVNSCCALLPRLKGRASRPSAQAITTHAALRTDGTPVCWGGASGLTDSGQSTPPEGEQFVQISSGFDHTCALRSDGTPLCWGAASEWWPDRGQASPPPGERFVAISSGQFFTCGLRDDGSHVCWRFGPGGEIPEGISSQGFESVKGRRLSSLSNGDRFTCAQSTWMEKPLCWGIDDYGQASPPTGERFVAVSSGARHACGLHQDGTAICWGDDAQGRAAPPRGETFVAISSGWAYTCAIRVDGSATCWGQDRYGEASPPQDERLIAISSSKRHTCALRVDGSAVCWGDDEDGQSSRA